MSEKMSDENKRISLAEAFKEKVNNEIQNILKRNLEELKTFLFEEINNENNEGYKDFKYLIDEITVCTETRRFINGYNFLRSQMIDFGNDIIVYNISSENLNIWMQEDYNFMNNLFRKYGLGAVDLTEDALEYEFTDVMDIVLYKKKSA